MTSTPSSIFNRGQERGVFSAASESITLLQKPLLAGITQPDIHRWLITAMYCARTGACTGPHGPRSTSASRGAPLPARNGTAEREEREVCRARGCAASSPAPHMFIQSRLMNIYSIILVPCMLDVSSTPCRNAKIEDLDSQTLNLLREEVMSSQKARTKRRSWKDSKQNQDTSSGARPQCTRPARQTAKAHSGHFRELAVSLIHTVPEAAYHYYHQIMCLVLEETDTGLLLKLFPITDYTAHIYTAISASILISFC